MENRFKILSKQHPIIFPGFLLFSVLDLVSTFIALSLGAAEGNPVAKYLLQQLGFTSLIVFKAGAVFLLTYSEPILNLIESRKRDDYTYNKYVKTVRENFTVTVIGFAFLMSFLAVINNFYIVSSLLQL